jgi:methionine--tRNA ligase beta chain
LRAVPEPDAAEIEPNAKTSVEGAFVTADDLARIDLRVGIVRHCERVPRKDRLLRLEVDIGEDPPRTILAGVAQWFAPEDLVGRSVVVLANVAPRTFGSSLVSHGMLIAAGDATTGPRLATVPNAPAGARLR